MNRKDDNENNATECFTKIKSAESDPTTRAMTGTITLEITRTKKNPVRGFNVRKLLNLKHNQSRE